jgi:hypothetical protein
MKTVLFLTVAGVVLLLPYLVLVVIPLPFQSSLDLNLSDAQFGWLIVSALAGLLVMGLASCAAFIALARTREPQN